MLQLRVSGYIQLQQRIVFADQFYQFGAAGNIQGSQNIILYVQVLQLCEYLDAGQVADSFPGAVKFFDRGCFLIADDSVLVFVKAPDDLLENRIRKAGLVNGRICQRRADGEQQSKEQRT